MKEHEGKYTSQRIAVPTDYEDVFSHFYSSWNKSACVITKTFLPSFQTILIFSFGAQPILHSKQNIEIRVNRCLVLGPIKQAFDYSLPSDSQILVANFKDDAFYRFFGNLSVSEHFPIDPDNLLNQDCFNFLWTQLNKMEDVQDRVSYILEFCKPYLKERNAIAAQLASFKDETKNPIKSIASLQNQTERNIQLNHKKTLGYTAKEISRYQRFLKTIELIERMTSKSTKIDWFEIIAKCGYYDQSQLIHDFKHYINISPSKYLKFQQDICIASGK
jgi:AraC-like DNA-binding protein